MGNPIWILECRTNIDNRIDSTFAYVSSTVEKGVDWIKENKDYDSGNYWWTIYYNEIDVDIENQEIPEKDLFIFNKEGEEIFWQPEANESALQYGDQVQVIVHRFSSSLSSDSLYLGTLIKAEDDNVLLHNLTIIEENDVSVNKPFKNEIFLKAEEIFHIKKFK